MNNTQENSIKTIQRRLVWTLVKVFLVVTSILIIVLLGATALAISTRASRDTFYKNPSASILEAYYTGRGSWDGINFLIKTNAGGVSGFVDAEWDRSILVDQNGAVVMYYGQPFPAVPMTTVDMPTDIRRLPLFVSGKEVGALITDNRDLPHPVRMAVNVLNPIIWISLLCAFITLLIGVLLMRRIVNPLSEVIAAAESVSAGKLNTRIKVRESQDDLGSLIEHFNRMTETLERNDNERRGMLADIAHELRTPLSVLRGRLEGIVDGVYTPNEVNISQALEETYLLERLVEDLHLLTLAETRQLHFEIKDTNLVELTEKIVTLFEPQANGKKVTLALDTENREIHTFIDPQRMEQVIGNLIGNSLRYVPAGGQINLGISNQEDAIIFKITDNGPGVPAEELPYIFDRFWRGEKSRARVTGGAGLGLAISKQLVETQGGQIHAANRPEGGLEITITLPT